jgi:SAM-dependent methyltransferase
MKDSRERFTDRVDDYVRHRPGYPDGVRDLLERDCGLRRGSGVADLGSGTGILSRLLLSAGARVFGVEPNAAMRAAAESTFATEEAFVSVEGTAEATGLAPTSIDLATAGQAFHWFDPARTRAELQRILRPGAHVALIWNVRASTPFNDDYEDLLVRFAPEYPAVRARDRASEATVSEVLAPQAVHVARIPNLQQFDEAGLRGRLMSSSYAPKDGEPTHPAMMARMKEIFAAHASQGLVEMAYETVVYWGIGKL